MDFVLKDDQRLIRDMVREFSRKELYDAAAEIDAEAKFPRDIFKKMSRLGLLGLSIPEKYSGGRMDALSIAIAVEEMAKGCASTAIIFAVHNIVSYAISNFGTDEQKKLLPELATGKTLTAMSLIEPDSSDCVVDLSLTASRQDGKYILNGEKRLVVGGEFFKHILLLAKDENYSPLLFIIDKEVDGIMRGDVEETVGIRGARCTKISFENAVIPAESVLGDENRQVDYLEKISSFAKILVSACAVGISERALELTTEYAFQRRQFEKFIGEFQGYRWMVADMDVDISSAQTHLYRTASLFEQGRASSRDCAIIKILSSRTAVKSTTDAIQLRGGIGYM
ncbi:acyl-CoA dehydrogenase family protein, partial [bacterium]|nr:acyl-CoA dehydrogenase family protein [bacterium]